MAFTLQERVNISKGINLNTPVEFVDKLDAAVKKWASELITGDTTKEQLPQFSTFSPTDQQIREWCYRALDSTAMAARMRASMISDPAMETNGIDSDDNTIINAAWYKIAAYAAKI